MYTPEQEEKIERLRKERDFERKLKHKEFARQIEKQERLELKVGDYVQVTINGKVLPGYIVKIIDDNNINLSTPYGVIENLKRYQHHIRKRYVEDVSNVVVPEVLKGMSTKKLLNLLSRYRLCESDVYNGQIITREMIKAELKNRPHVPSKREKKKVLDFIKSKK